jgi:hypothetical protein
MSEEPISVPTCYFRFIVVWHSGSKKKQLGILRFAGRVLEWQKTTYEDEQSLRDLVGVVGQTDGIDSAAAEISLSGGGRHDEMARQDPV